jgi:hypothetical protein
VKVTKTQLRQIIKEEITRLQKKTILENRKREIVRELKVLNEEVINDSILNELIHENSLYGRKVIEPLLKKLGDTSDDTINKLAIAGLFRNKFSPIQQIQSLEQLTQEFDKWYNNVIATITKTNAY